MPSPYYEHSEYPELQALCLAREEIPTEQGTQVLFCGLRAHDERHRHIAFTGTSLEETYSWSDR
jgi:hypothetical protein